jgi:hypothetical protein
MKVDLEEGDTLQHAVVVSRFQSHSGREMCRMEPAEETDIDHLKKEMKQIGWDFVFVDVKSGSVAFKSET